MDARRTGLRTLALAASLVIAALSLPARALAVSFEPYVLVATRDLQDPVFSETVILMIPVSEDGLVDGVIINRPTNVRVQDLISGAAVLPKPAEAAFFGGPVEVNTALILIRASRPLTGAIHVFEDVYVVAASEQINSYVKAPPEAGGVRLIMGRAQWMPDQLMAEMAEGSWYKAPAEVDDVFSQDPTKVWGVLEKRGQLQEAEVGEPDFFNSAGSCHLWECPKRLFFN